MTINGRADPTKQSVSRRNAQRSTAIESKQIEMLLVVEQRPTRNQEVDRTRESSRIVAMEQILTTSEVLKITGRHRCTLYRWMDQGIFPKRRESAGHPIGWARSEIERWMGQHPTRQLAGERS